MRGCTSLATIYVSNENPIYHSAGNCLIRTKDKTLILGCKNSVIPSDGSVTRIGRSAFYGCEGLNSISIPNSITHIGEWAFSNCTNLQYSAYDNAYYLGNSSNPYSFTAEIADASTIISVVVAGDSNGDGSITNADSTRLSAAYAGKVSIDALQSIAADVNGDGIITNADVTRLRAAYAEKTQLTW